MLQLSTTYSIPKNRIKRLLNFLVVIYLITNTYANADTADRIAVAGGSITEIIYRLGEEDRIVGVDSTSTYPEAATHHPTLGYVRNVSVEGLLSLTPDLLIGELDTGPPKVLNQIKAAGIKTVIIENDDSISAIKEKVLHVASLLNVDKKGKALINDLQIDIDALTYATQRINTSPRVLFLLSLSNGAPIAAGHTTSAHTAIVEAKGINVLANHKGWKKLSPESALALKPDVIVVMNRGDDVMQQVEKLPHFKYTPAVKNKAVYTIDGSYLLGFGPRTPQAIVELGGMIHSDFPLPEGYKLRYPSHVDAAQKTAGH